MFLINVQVLLFLQIYINLANPSSHKILDLNMSFALVKHKLWLLTLLQAIGLYFNWKTCVISYSISSTTELLVNMSIEVVELVNKALASPSIPKLLT